MQFATLNLSLPTLEVLDRLGLPMRGRTAEFWRGGCPFHRSATRWRASRSLEVSLALRKWRCWRCGRWGDLIDLWAGVRHLSLRAAALELAAEFAIGERD